MTKRILRNLPSFLVGIYLAGIVSSYGIYLIANKILKERDFMSIIRLVWSYPVLVKDNNAITLGKMIFSIFLSVLGYYLSKLLSKLLAERVFPRFKIEKGAVAALSNLSFYGLVTFFTLIALNASNIPLTFFTFLGGALAIGIGFGSQNLMNNFISGIILQLERPIKVGDTIEIDGSRGIVHHIGARSTVVNSSNGTTFILPNSNFLEKKVLNFSLFDNKVRSEVKVVVPVGQNLAELKLAVEKKLAEFPEILTNPKPELMFIDYIDAGTGVVLNLFFWIRLDENTSKTNLESRLRFAVHEIAFKDKEMK